VPGRGPLRPLGVGFFGAMLWGEVQRAGWDRWRAYNHFTTNLLAAIRQEPS
jgi:hypothetical protein